MTGVRLPAPVPAARVRVPSRTAALGLVLVAVAAAAAAAGVGSGEVVNAGGWTQARRFLEAAASPRVDASFLSLTADAALTTLAFAALGTALALVLGTAGGLLAARFWWRRRAPWIAVRALLAVPRGMHEVVWGLLLLAIVGLDPLVAVLAIGLPYAAVTAKVVADLLEEVDARPSAALRAAGAGRLAATLYGRLPLARRDLASYGFYRLECAIRSAAILGIIGAGGLGFQLALSFQSLRYDEVWTFLYALIALSGAADLWSSVVRRGRGVRPSAVAALGLTAWAWFWVSLDPRELLAGPVVGRLEDMAGRALPPALPAGGWPELASATLDTLAMSVLAGAMAGGGAALLAFPAARLGGRWPRRACAGLVRALLLVLRAVPPPVWALVCLFVLFPGILPGAVALAVYNLGVVGRLMAEAAENLDRRPGERLRASGASAGQAFLYATAPAAAGRFAVYALYRWEVAVRETIVVGAVGAGGLGLLLARQLAQFDVAAALTSVLAVIALTLGVDLASTALRRRLR